VSTNIQDIPLAAMDGKTHTLREYAGKVFLIVNVASKCGLTPQYDALEKLYNRFKSSGLMVLGFPANDFLAQEPGTDSEIAEFCRTNYSVSFPLFSKIAVTGDSQHPLYRELIRAVPTAEGDPEAFRRHLASYNIDTNPAPGVLWNFEKFLVAADGAVVQRFAPSVVPDDPRLVQAIESQLTSH
jgi:glutathione peroxidase